MTFVTKAKDLIRAGATVCAPYWWRVGKPHRLMILMYHRVLPLDHPAAAVEQPGMIVSPQTLARNLEWLSDFCEIVALEDWVRRAKNGGELPSTAAAITFDDGWADNYEYGLDILRRMSAPATIFLCPDLMDSGRHFWPNRLAHVLAAAQSRSPVPPLIADAARRAGVTLTGADQGLDRQSIDRVISACKAWSDSDVKDAIAEMERTGGLDSYQPRDVLTWTQVREMQESGLVRFGSHTRTHFRLLPGVASDVMNDEVAGSRTDLERRLKVPVTAFAYPNGDTTAEGVECVRSSYDLAVTTRWGPAFPGHDPHLLPRIAIHEGIGSSRRSFVSRLLGIG